MSSWLKVQDSAVVADVLNIEQVSLNVTLREFGGADRDRTDDILLAKQALSQLSYSPIWFTGFRGRPLHPLALLALIRRSLRNSPVASFYMKLRRVVGLDRFELSTSPLSGVRSSQLSYRPKRAAL